MLVLMQGFESKKRVKLLLKLTKIESKNIQTALLEYLCKGLTIDDAAMLNDVPRQNLSCALKRLNDVARTVEQIK